MQQRMGMRGSPRALSPAESERLAHGARWPIERLFAELHAQGQGLTEREAKARARRYGSNALPREPAWYRWLRPLRSIASPFNLLLALLAVLAWIADDARAAAVIGAMVLLSGVLRGVQELRAQTALTRLARLVHSTATVLRRAPPRAAEARAGAIELPMEALVPGDVVLLAAGDIVPADCRLIESRQLFVAQASLTGESMPVEKNAFFSGPSATGLLTEPTLVFQGTTVVSGAASALVLATGRSTLFGSLAMSAGTQHSGSDPLQQEMNRIGLLLLGIASVMLPLVFLINGLLRGDWPEAFLFALSVAVGLTPEMLPMVVTAALAKGAVDLSGQKVVVRRLDAIQALGAMDVLCIDKTGTLTEDRIVQDRHLDAAGGESDQVFQLAWLNSRNQTGLRSALDRAVLSHADARALAVPDLNWRALDEIPFDFERRRLSVVLEGQGGERRLVCKGAVEEVLGCCTMVRLAGVERPFDEAERAAVRARVSVLEQDGLRVVAIADRAIERSQVRFGRDDEANLTLAGFVAFLDPPRDTAAPALDALAAHGVRTIVLTGDSQTVAASVCARVGLQSPSILTGVPELVPAPRRWDPGEFRRFMLMSAPVSSFFDLLAFGVLAWVLQVATTEHQALFQSAWLMLGLATQVLVVQLLRAPELPLRHQRAAWPVTLASLAVLLVGWWLPFGPLAAIFGLAPPPDAWFAWMLLLLGGYLLVMMPVRRRLAAAARQS